MKSWALCLVLHLKRYCIILITLVFPLFCWWSPCFHRTACHSCPWIFRLTDILYSQHTSCLAVAAMVRGVGKGWFSLTQPLPSQALLVLSLFSPLPLKGVLLFEFLCTFPLLKLTPLLLQLWFLVVFVFSVFGKYTYVLSILMCHWFSFTGREDCIKNDFWGQNEGIHWSGMTY